MSGVPGGVDAGATESSLFDRELRFSISKADFHHPLNKLKEKELPCELKHFVEEFVPIKRLFRSFLVRNEKSARLQ